MSGIAGILKRDGGPVPENWATLLEHSLLLHSSNTFRFEDSIPVQEGNLYILLLSGSGTPLPGMHAEDEGIDPIVVDGALHDDCVFAQWHEETLQLELGRHGSGKKPLYWLDLAEAGDGVLFSSNPLPLLKIATELGLPIALQEGVAEYLQLGYAVEGGALLAPICSMPIKSTPQKVCTGARTLQADISSTPAEDVKTLVTILGKPFADCNVLSTLWQYRSAKEQGASVLDGIATSLGVPSPFLQRVLPTSKIEQLHQEHRAPAKKIELGVIAQYVGVPLHVSESLAPIPPIQMPLASWLKNPVSSLGELATETFACTKAFKGLSIEQDACVALLHTHQSGESDNSEHIFALLTLLLWRLQVLA